MQFGTFGIYQQLPPFGANSSYNDVQNSICSSFLRAKLKQNCEIQRTVYVQGQISKYIFKVNGAHCVYCASNIFYDTFSFEY